MTLTADTLPPARPLPRNASRPTYLVWPFFAFFVFLFSFPAIFILYQKTQLPRAYSRCANFSLPASQIPLELPAKPPASPALLPLFPPPELVNFLTLAKCRDSNRILAQLGVSPATSPYPSSPYPSIPSSLSPPPTPAPRRTVFLHERTNVSLESRVIFTFAYTSSSASADINVHLVHYTFQLPAGTDDNVAATRVWEDIFHFQSTDIVRILPGEPDPKIPNAYKIPIEVNATRHTATYMLGPTSVSLFSLSPPLDMN